METSHAALQRSARHISRRALLAGSLGAAAIPLLPGCSSHGPPRFEAVGGVIKDPDGKIFTPIGANVGEQGSFDWKGTARGHAADALEWRWNTIRLNVMVTDAASWSYAAAHGQEALLKLVSGIVDEYTQAGIVVIIDAHDNPRSPGYDQAAVETKMITWWTTASAAFRDNPRVWCGLINEPNYVNDQWLRIMDTLANAVRATGNRNPILVGAPCWGQDLGPVQQYFPDARFSYESEMAPSLAKRHGNVILEQHNYGAYGKYSTKDKFAAYINRVRSAGLTPLVGEFGYTIDRTSTAGSFMANYDGAQAVFDVVRELQLGALWWHGTHGDKYSLKANGAAFWAGGNGNGLSDGGAKLWALSHS